MPVEEGEPMRKTSSSLWRRIRSMSMAWLCLGLAIGLLEGLRQGGLVPIVSMTIGAMTILPMVGFVLALIGGDVQGSLAGAGIGLIGCLAIDLDGGVLLPSQGKGAIIIFCALVGATCCMFSRFLIWRYTLIFRAIGWLIGITPASGRASAFLGHFHSIPSGRLTGLPPHHSTRPILNRSQ
jgi:hypothetical protein